MSAYRIAAPQSEPTQADERPAWNTRPPEPPRRSPCEAAAEVLEHVLSLRERGDAEPLSDEALATVRSLPNPSWLAAVPTNVLREAIENLRDERLTPSPWLALYELECASRSEAR